MREYQGDIWQFRQPGDWVCVTTNTEIKKNGQLVMGKGIAFEAAKRYPMLASALAFRQRQFGYQIEVIDNLDINKIISFPTKIFWRSKSDINLILRSTIQLVDAATRIKGRILLPRPGCSNGGLEWLEVKPLLENYLTDNRFIIFSKPGE